jgi:hypothetical protein
MNVFSMTLQARNPERGHFRHYHLEAGRDLFGTWLVEATFGPIGAAGRTVGYAAADETEARRIARHCLRRRTTAPRRIGTSYEVKNARDPEWLSPATVR